MTETAATPTGVAAGRGRTWIWQAATRCTGVFSEHGKTLTAHHERSDDDVDWAPSMDVTLRKVE